MEVKKAEYFHIHRVNDSSSIWEVGSRINWVQKKLNLFNEHYNKNGLFYNDGVDNLPFRQAMEKFFNATPEYQNAHIGNMLAMSQEVGKSLSMFVREQIFEEVRSNYFPHLPSRKNCIWVCSKEAVPFWWDTLGAENQKILKLSLTGSLFISDQKHLLADTVRHDDLRALAFEYWTGSDGLNVEDQEVLFEGIIDVVDSFESKEQFLAHA
ncbi:TPA: DUF2441 domain-containing protein [Vibrio diabolicus]|uniref:DUF2441 domain-containing protein n=1 Tax=Vibrio harveyi TaxID=669 RepID=UPI00390ABC28